MKILIGGDLVPTESNQEKFIKADAEYLIGEDLSRLLNSADFIIMNLEVPLTSKSDPIAKCGPNLIASPETITGIEKINPYFFTLANNHIYDQGEQGVLDTMHLLGQHRIAFSGVGNGTDASNPFVFEKDNKRIGIYCCAEHEFSIAGNDHLGANPFDPLESPDHIAALKQKCEYVIVLYHGGKEHYRYPSPDLRKTCRKLAEKGADLVLCQHSHCIGAEEQWGNSRIVYGQGNFLFDDMPMDNEYWASSLLIELDLQDGCKIVYHPLKRVDGGVRLAGGREGDEILNGFYQRSEEITSSDFVQQAYDSLAERNIADYLGSFHRRVMRSFIFRALNKLSGKKLDSAYLKWCYCRDDRLRFINILECEAHREVFLRGLHNMSGRP